MGAIVAAAGDRFRVSGKLGDDTRNNLAWNTDSTTLQFSAAPGGVLDLAGVGGDVGTAVAGRIIGNGFNVYYDPALSRNVWLGGQASALGAGGSLASLRCGRVSVTMPDMGGKSVFESLVFLSSVSERRPHPPVSGGATGNARGQNAVIFQTEVTP